ncbi:hypothetical protein ES707_00346 [subsurface metagenome]
MFLKIAKERECMFLLWTGELALRLSPLNLGWRV